MRLSFPPPIEDTDNLLVPVICMYEVFKKVNTVADEARSLQIIAQMKQGRVMDVTEEIALKASLISLKHKLPMADSLILSTAQALDAILWTQDEHFKHLQNVNFKEARTKSSGYVAKRAAPDLSRSARASHVRRNAALTSFAALASERHYTKETLVIHIHMAYCVYERMKRNMTRTNVVLDDALVEKCQRVTGIQTRRSVIDHALRELLRHGNQKKILTLKGKVTWDGDLRSWRAGRGLR